jgi:thiamine-phosphate pyrophosphorylase
LCQVSGATSRRRLAAARLYAITPDLEPEQILWLVGAWLRGGADVVQLRHKSMPRPRLLELAHRLAPACVEAGVPFIVNDHLDVARESGADGVHLGPGDLAVATARREAGPELLIGASASTPPAAVAAERAGADYLGTGPAYPTPLKTEKRVIGPAAVAAVQAAVRVPVFAIGGVEPERVPELKAAGVLRVCVIRALAGTDPEGAARSFKAALA